MYTKAEKEYQEHLEAGRFMLLQRRDTGVAMFPPRVAERGSGNSDLVWKKASGRGTVYSTTVIRPKPPAQPYNLALIDLWEGPRMMSRVEGLAPENVRIGMNVSARVAKDDALWMVVFDADSGDQS